MMPTLIMVPSPQAMSSSASSNTTLADLPPSSSVAGFMVSAHACRILLAVAGPPVKETLRTLGWTTNASPAAGSPGKMLHTPAGKPASSTRSMNSSAEKGVSSDGLQTTVQPAASAAGIFMASEIRGPFQVMMMPMTPYGSSNV